MSVVEAVIIDTGCANLASVRAALRRCGVEGQVSSEPRNVDRTELAILPGVGAFATAMEQLHQRELVAPLRARVAAGRPLLAICLGMQLLCESSEESPGTPGLGVVPGVVRRFPVSVRAPQLGWNHVMPERECELIENGYAYFANSFCLTAAPIGWNVARSRHGVEFIAALQRGPLLACQFHPELSGSWGRELLRRWLETALSAGGARC